MFKGITVTVLALLSTVTARPEPQFFFSGTPYASAYTAPVAPVSPVVSTLPTVSTIPTVPTLPNTYPGPYPTSVSMYSYGYQTTYPEVPLPVVNPSANLVYSSAYSLPYRSYNYAPTAAYIDLAYKK